MRTWLAGDLPTAATADTASLELILYGASPITGELLARGQQAFDCDFAQMYGMTETGAATLLSRADHRDEGRHDRLRSAGRPVPGFEVEVGQDEILVRSRAVVAGYWGADDATAHAIRGGGMHTGDAGHRDADGYVYITDRIKDLVITGGENVSGIEVETALDEDALDAHVRERLAAYKRPRSYAVVDALPRNAMGKVLKHVLRGDQPAP